MSTRDEITELEERLRQAELGPDPRFFEDALADDAVIVGEGGEPTFAKAQIVKAHEAGLGPKFTRVEMSELEVVDHGSAAVVTCRGTYEGPTGTFTLRFLRVWCRKGDRWRIIAASMSR